jgi:hypothetical protein
MALSKLGNVLHKQLLGISIHHSSFVLLAVRVILLLIPSPSHIHHYQFSVWYCLKIFKRGEAKMDDAQLITHGNKEDVVIQLEGQGDGRSNKTEMKVRAMFL